MHPFNTYSVKTLRTAVRLVTLALLGIAGFLLLGISDSFLLAFLPLIVALLFIEQYYSSPATVLANTFALGLLLLSEYDTLLANDQVPALILLSMVTVSLLGLSLFLKTKQDSETDFIKKMRRVVGDFGSAKFLYAFVFLTFVAIDGFSGTPFVLALGIVFFLALFSKDIHSFIDSVASRLASDMPDSEAVGTVTASLGGRVLKMRLEKALPEGTMLAVKDDDNQEHDVMLFKVSVFDQVIHGEGLLIQAESIPLSNTSIYKKVGEYEGKYAGRVSAGSDIEKVIFEPFKETGLEQGDVVSIQTGEKNEKTVLYQVTNAVTGEHAIASEVSSGKLSVHAEQLGSYNVKDRTFDSHGWVPSLNQTTKSVKELSEVPAKQKGEFQLGLLPNTNFPIFLDLDEAITHHTAIFGVTGSGKSYLAKKILREYTEHGTKVVCVDFNGEYSDEIPDLKKLSDFGGVDDSELDTLTDEKGKWPDKRTPGAIKRIEDSLHKEFTDAIEKFVASDDMYLGFDLPSLDNTASSLEYTRIFLKALFEYAKSQPANQKKKICLLLEEAHTVVPEGQFASDNSTVSKALINGIGQIALQGRKYGVGLLVITQRTANVSKTVLTQCNTVICLQSFDNTTKDFLSNYVGTDFVQNISSLQKHHAVVAGKAVSNIRPVIVDLHDE